LVKLKEYSATDKVELFPQKGGWYYIKIPLNITKPFQNKADRGLIAIKARVGDYTWDTSLLPLGDGTHFIPLNAKVRKKESIDIGDRITIYFTLR
jgi:hypothetical protein